LLIYENIVLKLKQEHNNADLDDLFMSSIQNEREVVSYSIIKVPAQMNKKEHSSISSMKK